MIDMPDWLKGIDGQAFTDAVTEVFTTASIAIEKLAEQVKPVFAAQGAVGFAIRGELGQARMELDDLSADQLRTVSAAAAAVSSLAEELAAGKADASDV